MANQSDSSATYGAGPTPVSPQLVHDLRTAMTIELATLPTYLYTYWSIKPRSQGGSVAGEQAAKVILSVVTEEMLHFALVGNIINSLGVTPAVNDPTYIPTYPGSLPGHSSTENPFVVSLQPLNALAIKIMLDIELPASVEDLTTPPTTDGWATIGEFYAALKKELTPDLDYSHGRQLAPDNNPGPGVLIQVDSHRAAMQAINEIVDQGEGFTLPKKGPQERDGDHELAHYYKFLEIKEAWDAGVIDASRDVYPVIGDPFTGVFNAEQQAANKAFNVLYSQLLDSLQNTLTSPSPNVWGAPTRYMVDMQQAVNYLRNTGEVAGTGKLPGPTFEYIPASDR